MKKILIVFVAFLLFAVTGCGEKKLTCTMTEDGQTMEVVMNFDKNDEIKTATMNMTMPFEEELTEEEQEQVNSYMGLVCSMYNYDEVECNVNTTAKESKVNIVIDFANMSDETKEALGYSGEGSKYDEIRKSAEEDGYTCK